MKKFRLQSPKAATRQDAATPHLFQEIRFRKIPENLLVIPSVSSEKRPYIPIGFIDNETVGTNLVHLVPNAGLYEFAILTSAMHQAWMRRVCGRLEMRYRYSRDLCYNTFPWPRASAAQRESIAVLAASVLEAREQRPDLALAQMYDPEKMPSELRMAHQELDLAVDALYRKKGMAGESGRLALLFGLYEKLRAGKIL